MLILQPWWERHMQEKQKQSMMEQWNMLQFDHVEPLRWPQTDSAGMSGESRPVTEAEPEPQDDPVMIDGFAVLGTLSIGKLNLKEPIIMGTDSAVLKAGIGVVEPERRPGIPGNFVLAGHRSWTFGKQFSRLDELEAGDRIVVDTPQNSYVYSVTSRFLVKPDNLSVLDQKRDQAEMTLITCEPKVNPTHRLIVKAVLDEKTHNTG
ncbi:class D sortase [Paenibacillus konkukensis]|nr:class D sortase [Paenibacillus konkukensis]